MLLCHAFEQGVMSVLESLAVTVSLSPVTSCLVCFFTDPHDDQSESNKGLCFGWWLKFPWQCGEYEVELIVAIWLVDRSATAAPQQAQLKVCFENLQQLFITLKLWGRKQQLSLWCWQTFHYKNLFIYLLLLFIYLLPCRIFCALIV